jgi:hypothetical protein
MKVCSGRGICSSPNNCTCNSGYSGVQCDNFQCFGKASNDSTACTSRGKCIAFDTCNCTSSGHFGNRCQFEGCYGKNKTDPTVCSSRGSCSSLNNCTCNSGYTGNSCENTVCFGKISSDPTVCSGSGKCTSPNNCICDTGFSGTECQTREGPIRSQCQPLKGGQKIEWSIQGNLLQVTLTFSSAPKWGAIGFNTVGQSMVGASIVMAYPGNINEYTGSSFAQPTLITPKISNSTVDTSSGKMVIKFTRPLTGANYFTIKNETLSLLVSYNTESEPSSPTTFSKHSVANFETINFFASTDLTCSSTKSLISSGIFILLGIFYFLMN